jgi:hypothetical protein
MLLHLFSLNQTIGMSPAEMQSILEGIQSSQETGQMRPNAQEPVGLDDGVYYTDSQLNALLDSSVLRDTPSDSSTGLAMDERGVSEVLDVFSATEKDEINQPLDEVIDTAAAAPAAQSSSAGDEDTYTKEQQQMLVMFCGVTGSEDMALAKQLLLVSSLFLFLSLSLLLFRFL